MSKAESKIPEGWSVKKLGDLSTNGIFNGVFNDPKKVGIGTHLINVVDLYQDNINYNRLSLLDVSFEEVEKYEAICGDLLFTRSSLKMEGIAHCNLVKKYPNKTVFDCHIMRIRPNQKIVNSFYLFTYCNTLHAKNEFIKNSKTTTMTTIDQLGLGAVKILLPPLAEQEKIAGVLECWDDGIEKLDSLIKAKEKQKKALMQKLLTGNVRLAGFFQPWKDVKLGSMCEITSGTSKSQYIEDEGHYFIVDMGAVSNNGQLIARKKTTHAQDFLNINDLIMPKDDIGGGNIIGKTIVIQENNKYILGDHVFKITTSKMIPILLSYLINSAEINKFMRRMSTGSAQLGLAKKDVVKTKLHIPTDLAEQKAIADVLSTADDEINLLKQKLSAFKEQKKGLMQQLLTGKIRVKVN